MHTFANGIHKIKEENYETIIHYVRICTLSFEPQGR